MNLVTGGAIRVTENPGLLVLRHDTFVAALAIHTSSPIPGLCSVRVMAQSTGIDVTVRGVSTNDQFAE